MAANTPLIDLSYINDVLSGDKKFLKEFSEAAILSFTEFCESYALSLQNREQDELRKAGHKIKPVAQMLNVQPLLDIYESSKELLNEQAGDEELHESAKEMNMICAKIIAELKHIISTI